MFKETLKQKAHDLGFTLFGVASLVDIAHSKALSHYDTWIDDGNALNMGYLIRHRETKAKPELFLKGAQSIVCVGLPYAQDIASTNVRKEDVPYVSQYALGRDYHEIIEEKLKVLIAEVSERYPKEKCRSFVDAQAVLDRFWASRAGLGWVGKNTCLIHRKEGSYFFIGGFLTTLNFQADAPYTEHCGRCTMCIDACPTEAIQPLKDSTKPNTIPRYAVITEKCIGYHTIENHGKTPVEIMNQSKTWIAGCDICQEVCPWNDPLQASKEFHLENSVAKTSYVELSLWNEEDFKMNLKGFAMRRMKYVGFLKNLVITATNSSLSTEMKHQVLSNIETHSVKLNSEQKDILVSTLSWAREKVLEK